MAGGEGEALIEVRLLTRHEEFAEAVQLQREIWGFQETDLLPVRLFVVADKIGGHSFGGYDGERMAGFCLGIPGIKPGGGGYLHSHMLGVRTEYRDRGVGRMLKLAQREESLRRGVGLIEWTFDPLEIKNAWFNIERLGAVVSRYVLNQYGISSSRLHGGLPTDRCVAEWHLDTERVRAVLAGQRVDGPRIEERIEVPGEVRRLREQEPGKAREMQARISERFLECFGRGLTVTGLERFGEDGVYLLSQWQS